MKRLLAVVAAVVAVFGLAGPVWAAKPAPASASALVTTCPPAQTWWTPCAAAPLPMHWALDTGAGDPPIDTANPWHIGQRTRAGGTLPAPAVLDIDGDYNTRDVDAASYAHVSRGVVETLHARGQKAICYMDTGVQEMNGTNTVYDREPPYRVPVDRQDKQSGWGGYWIDFTEPGTGTPNPDPQILAVVEQRIVDWCVTGGFDAVEFDEVDYWENNPTSPDVTYASQLTYNRALFGLAHSHNLAAIQKGDIIQTQDLVGYADATLNEECYRYRECTNPWNPDTGQEQVGLQAYTQQGKAVWVAEYTTNATTRMCADAPARQWNGARYYLGLPAGPPNTTNGGRDPCAGW